MSISISPKKRRVSADLIILFFLYEENRFNPYQMRSCLKELKITDWIPLSMRTIYYAMTRLEEEGFITGDKKPFHTRHDTTEFSITKAGKRYLEKALEEEFANFQRETFTTSLPLGLNAFLPLKFKKSIIEKRIKWLKKREQEIKKRIKNYDLDSPFAEWLLIDHERAFLLFEIKWWQRAAKLMADDSLEHNFK